MRLHHLAERPEGDALAVWKRTALPPVDELSGSRSTDLGELPDEPALADAGDADERDELNVRSSPGTRERRMQEIELPLPADERSAAGLLESTPKRDRGLDGAHAGTGSALPFAWTGPTSS